MKKTIVSMIFLSFLSCVTLAAQKKFEGNVRYHVKYEGENIQLNVFIRNNNLRMDKNSSAGNETYLCINGMSVVLHPEQQIYVEYSDIKDRFIDSKPPLFDNMKDELILLKTDVKGKIAGIECEKWILKNQITSVELWVNKEIGFNENLVDLFPKYMVNWEEVVKKENVFPLLIEIKDQLGNTIYSFEASDIDFKTPGKNLFVIPDSFKKIEKNTK